MRADYFSADGLRACPNPLAAAAAEPYGAARAAILNEAGFRTARREISQWPGYAATPLRANQPMLPFMTPPPGRACRR